MYFVLFTMHNPDLVEELLEAWTRAGVQRATILPSTGMRRLRQKGMRDDIPLMPSLSDFYETGESFSRTIFTTVQEESMIDKILATTENVVGDLRDHETGVFLVLPILRAHGLDKRD
jgi:nitrogen regulatory protein P-II 1